MYSSTLDILFNAYTHVPIGGAVVRGLDYRLHGVCSDILYPARPYARSLGQAVRPYARSLGQAVLSLRLTRSCSVADR